MNQIFPRIILSAVIFSGPAVALAQSQKTDIRPHANRLMGGAITAEFKGATHEGAYNFSDEGEPRRFYTETTDEKGRTTYSEGNHTAMGDWIVNKDALCFRYDNDELSSGCFRVYKVGNCFYYYSTEYILRRNELDREYWTARSVKAGEAPSCDPGLS